MTDNMIELGKRAVACKGWRWMPGMLAVTSNGVVGFRVADSAVVPTCLVGLPDFTDPATFGCLLALVREAWGDSEMHMALGAKGWVWLTGESRAYDVVMPINAGATEAEALVAALENAPQQG
jgi:hypothetical protein